MIQHIIFAVAAGILGLNVGSFLNVCIWRIPAGRSIIYPSSACPECGEKLRWYHNIPVFSWLFLRGWCAFCGAPISIRYPLVELLTGGLFLLTFLFHGLSPDTLFIFIFTAGMIVIAFIDIDTQDVYYSTVLPLILSGILRALFVDNVSVWEAMIGGGGAALTLLLVIVVFYLITGKIGMGFGDVLIFSAVGTHVRIVSLPWVLFVASLTGIAVFLFLKLFSGTKTIAENVTKEDLRTDDESDLQRAIYFGPFLAFSGILFMVVPVDGIMMLL